MRHWGEHAMIDAHACDRSTFTLENIREFVRALVDALGMVAYGEPVVATFAEHAEETAGPSFTQLISTSHLSGHFVDSNGDAYFDAFSCREVDLATFKRVVQDYFAPASMRATFVTRQAHA